MIGSIMSIVAGDPIDTAARRDDARRVGDLRRPEEDDASPLVGVLVGVAFSIPIWASFAVAIWFLTR